MSCPSFEALAGWIDGDDSLDEHLFACDECARRAERLVRLTMALKSTVRRGAIRCGITRALLDRLIADGVRVREYRVAPGGSTPCTARVDADLVAVHLDADLRQVERLDMSFEDDLGIKFLVEDVPFDRESGEWAYVTPGEIVRARPTSVIIMRLLDGERLLGEYRLLHEGV